VPAQEPDERLRLNGYVEKVIARGTSSRDEVLRDVAAITATDHFRTLQEKACRLRATE
jgi:hypothetical protein